MRILVRCAAVLVLVGLGYLLGAGGALSPRSAGAQAAADPDALSDEALARVKKADEELLSAMQVLETEKKYVPATTGLNAFAVSVGGVNALDDLKSGRGVDPETFVALYAGLANEEVAKDIGRDAEGRVTYAGKVVQLYPVSRLQRLLAAREQILQGE